MRSSDSLTPLINAPSSTKKLDNESSSSIFNRARRIISVCHPIALFGILLLCVLALLYPVWNKTSYNTPSEIKLNDKNDVTLKYHVAAANREADKVTSLYGLDNIDDYSMYSGYVTATNDRELHYWLIEATEVDADIAPLIIWTNGGPGCSGLLGLISEQGPFWTMSEDSLTENEYAWTKIANMVFFEQPYGVGFSTVSSGDSYVSGDADSADDFDAAIRSFLEKFPKYQGRDTYLSAESFGGHYVPTTALNILNNNEDGSTPMINLKGFLVGNPYTDQFENTMGFIQGLYGHGLTENSIYQLWQDNCYGDYVALDNSDLCDSVYVQSYYQASNIDFYALDFDDCSSDESWGVLKWQVSKKVKNLVAKFKTEDDWNEFKQAHLIEHNIQITLKHSDIIDLSRRLNLDASKAASPEEEKEMELLQKANEPMMELQPREDRPVERMNNYADMMSPLVGKPFKPQTIAGRGGVFNKDLTGRMTSKRHLLNMNSGYMYEPCIMDYATTWFNLDAVQTDLNVKSTTWSKCNEEVNEAWPDSDWESFMETYYVEINERWPDFKMLVYSGDDDSVCGTHGTQFWLDNMGAYGWNVDDDNTWTAIEFDDQVGGYYTRYTNSDGERALHFHTIRSAGHMVPSTQPKRSLHLLKSFLKTMD